MEKTNFENISEKDQELILIAANDETKQKDFYEKIRHSVKEYIKAHPNAKYIDYMMMLPDFFHLMCKLFTDTRVPIENKFYLGCAIVYCIHPLDIIPDFIPGGLTDDVLLIIKTLSDLIQSVDNTIILEHWTGNENIIQIIEHLSKMTSENLNKEKIAKKIAEFLHRKK